MSDAMDTLNHHYRETRVLIILVLSIVLLSTVYFFGSTTSRLENMDNTGFENRRRIELLERDFDRLYETLRQRAPTEWTRKDMQLYCNLFSQENPGAKCPDVGRIPADAFDTAVPLPQRLNRSQSSP